MHASFHSVSIIIPTLNEAENVRPLVSAIIASGVTFKEFVFVDGGSTDGTQDVIRSVSENAPVRLIEQSGEDVGLAAAIMIGAHAANGELLVVMDADLSHPPDRISDLLAPLFAGTADLVIGSRYVAHGSTPGWPLWRRMISRAASLIAQPLTGVRDSMCGFFAIERSRLIDVAPPTVGFKIVFETIVHAGNDLRVCEIPIAFRDRAFGQSKMSLAMAARFFWRWLIAIYHRGLGKRRHQSPLT